MYLYPSMLLYMNFLHTPNIIVSKYNILPLYNVYNTY